MDLERLYDNLVLRDLLQYTAPGAVVLTAAVLVIQALETRMDFEIAFTAAAQKSPWPVLILFLLLAYVTGHLLAALRAGVFRGADRGLACETLQRSAWLKSRIAFLVSLTAKVPEPEAMRMLEDAEKAESLCALGRSIVHHRAPRLYREFIGRDSSLSHFCQSMAIAIGFFLASVVVSVPVAWSEVLEDTRIAPVAVLAGLTGILVVGLLAILVLLFQATRLRRNVARRTFETWYIASGVQFAESQQA